MNPEIKITKKQYNNLTKIIKRREKGEPVAYILGYKDFMGLRFKVNRDVLIPRPETEQLVYKVYKGKKALKILDLGTGSGCIAIALAKQLQKSKIKYQVTASDVSKKALKVARQNAQTHKVKIIFKHSDILQNVRMSFDVIIANLPYVTSGDYYRLKQNLKFEPKMALTDGTNRWETYKRFFEEVGKRLNPRAVIFLEIDPRSISKILIWIKKYLPKAKVRFYKDVNRLWRYAIIKN